MRDGSDRMGEKGFLMLFINHIGRLKGTKTVFHSISSQNIAKKEIDDFLEIVHKHFYEVEFIRKEKESEDEYNTYEVRTGS
jgi:hypothetical protein